MPMPTIAYKNYELKSASHQLSETKKWRPSLTIIILKDKEGNAQTQTVIIKDTFDTKKDAETYSYNLGKEIIDGKHPDIKLPF